MSGRGVGACEKLLDTCALASERNMTLSAVRHIFSLTVSFKFCKSQLQRWNLNTRTSATANRTNGRFKWRETNDSNSD